MTDKLLPLSQKALDNNIIRKNIIFAYARISDSPKDADEVLRIEKDILKMFCDMQEIHIERAMNRGSSGEYGIVRKITFNVIGYWIHRYREEKDKSIWVKRPIPPKKGNNVDNEYNQ